jgi:hypothetical protein
MMSRSLILASIVTMLTSVACGNASFFGGDSGSKSKKQTSPSGQSTGGPTTDGQLPPGQNPGGQNPNSQNPNAQNPNGLPPGSQTPGGQTPGSQNPQIGPNSQVTQPNPNTIIFGQDKVFHIGDGRFENTSCKEEVSQLPLNGTAYFFQFEVPTDNTSVTVNVAKICGTDYTTNTFEIFSGNTRLQGQYVKTATPSIAGTALTLKKGIYTIVLTSGWGNDGGASDRDDYIVGKVTVSGNQPVRPVQYGAYNR